ncbi:hypothetical protein HY994_03460 [Candidatus Micrarchaeota archaeon]|nr:hypothetical protein [Candidatus Micrarchaeota archaeon]
MMLRPISVFVFFVFAALLLFGCVGSGNVDAVTAAKTSSQIQAYLQAHPNAKIVVLLQSNAQLAASLKQVPECASITAKSAYQVTFTDSDTGAKTSTTAVSFVNPDNGQVLCAVVNSANNSSAIVTGSTSAQASATSRVSVGANGSSTSGSRANVLAETSASVSGQDLIEYNAEEQGFRVLKPADWDADVLDDSYLLVRKDENTDALIWPIKLQGKYAAMTGVDLGNYIIGLSKDAYPDFKTESILLAPDKSSMEVVATVSNPDDASVKLKIVFTSFVDANGNGILSGYEAPVDQFDATEALLRKIVASYAPIVTEKTKAAVGPVTSVGAQIGGTTGIGSSIQLTPFTASDGSFHFQAPSGWKISGLGQCSTRSMAAYDPNNPVRREFVIDSNTLALPLSQLTSDAAVLEITSRLSQYEPAYGSVGNVQIVGGKEPYPSAQGMSGLVDSGIFMATMTIDGKPAKGRFGVILYNPALAAIPGFAYIIFSGEIADAADFDALRPALDQSISGFEIDQQYANACSASNQADISRRTGDISKTLSDTSDIITSGYNERSAVQDRVAQKWSDTTLGVDRVYNPDSDQVYQVPNDFYANYDLNRQSFEQQNLQQLTPDQWNQYAPLDGKLNIR